ncbi:MAG: histidine phosphatase family protein [Patescibacteria group bacterium]|jgi:broad specificity phosphatase PhoE
MSMTITYVVHGTTTDNEKGIATGWLPGALSALGIEQSKELGELLKDKQFEAVFCSDLKRAVDSAHLVFGDRYDIIQDKRLREANYGDWNGKPDTFKNTLEKYISAPFPNGESFQDVEGRMRGFIQDIQNTYTGKSIAIVAHQAPQLALEVICNGKTWEQAITNDWRKTKSWQPGWTYINLAL